MWWSPTGASMGSCYGSPLREWKGRTYNAVRVGCLTLVPAGIGTSSWQCAFCADMPGLSA